MEMQARFLVYHGPIAFPAALLKFLGCRKPTRLTQLAGKDAAHDYK